MAEPTQHEKFTKIYFFLWGLCVFAAVVAFVFYKFGFRLTNRFAPVKVGAVELTSNETDLQIFLDNREQKVHYQDDHYLINNITPGLHSLLVSKDNFWPWTKTFMVTQNDTRKLYAFIFSTDGLKIAPASQKDREWASEASRDSRAFVSLPESSNFKLLSADKNTVLSVEYNTIYAEWVSETDPPPRYFCLENPCKFKLPVTVSAEPIKNVDFYKGRGDVIIFSAGSTIYAIEVDHEGTQNFQPIFRGIDPVFHETLIGGVYEFFIKDGDSLLKAGL